MAVPISNKSGPVLAVYSDPQPLWDARPSMTLTDWGVNAIFQHSGSLTPAVVARATREGARVFAEFPTFRADYLVKEYPELWPIDAYGRQVPKTDRFLGACPSKPAMQEIKFGALRQLIERFDLSGVWLDYLHFHCDFELPAPTMDQTCFCDDCLRSFATFADTDMPTAGRSTAATAILRDHAAEWAAWKVHMITTWAQQARRVLDAVRPGILLGIYSCPWRDDEFAGALRTVLGVDFSALSVIDVWSPMLYHRKCDRRPSWVAQYTSWLVARLQSMGTSRASAAEVWPIIDAFETDPTEFTTILQSGLAASSGGIQVFTAAYAAEETRRQVLIDVYRSVLGG